MKLFARTQPLAEYPILRGLAVIKQLGFDGVEVCLENPDLTVDLLTPEMVARVRDKLAELGMRDYSISLHKDYIYDDGLFAETQRAIRLTRSFGAEIFVLAGTRKRTGDAAEWQRMVQRMRVLVEIAAGEGVTLAEEFEPGFIVGSTAELLRLFAEIPSPALAANLDLGHVFLCDPDPLTAIRQVGGKIVHGHIENMKTGVHNHLLPQEGDMDLRAYLRALAAVGFKGGLALDLYKLDYAAVAPGCLAYLRGLM
jgi:sugar phosphate isomerase/epimerase